MNRSSLKYKLLTAAAAAAIAASCLTSCSSIQASITVPGSSSSVTYEKTVSLPQVQAVQTPDSSGSQKIEYYFPRGGQKAQPQLIKIINSSEKNLDIAIYSLTDKQVCSAIIQAHKRGVAVRLISDREQSSGQYQKAIIKQIHNAGIPVKIDTHTGIMHLKVTIADQKTATTGSFNYTKSAEESNDEVFVVINDEKTAQDFEAQFNRMWNDKKNFTDYK